MEYDPVKDAIARWVRGRPAARRAFYAALDWIFLRTWYVQDALERYLAPMAARAEDEPLEVLDAGSGFGQYTYHLVRRFPGLRVSAVDVKARYLEDCRTFFREEGLDDRVRWLEGDLTSEAPQPFDRENGYAFILAVDVMEHIEDDQFVLDRFARLLEPGGYLLVNTPSSEGGSDARSSDEAGFIDEHARPGYDRELLRERLERAGLRQVESRYGYGPVGSAAWRMLIRVPISLLGRSRWWAPVVALYYLPVLPIGLLLNAVDLRRSNETGTGLTVVARKSVP